MKRVIHFEIHAENTEKVADFYRLVFGWDIRRWNNPDVDYWMVMTAPEGSTERGIDGGIVKREGPLPRGGEPKTAFVCTIDVPSVDAGIKLVQDAGGSLVKPKMAIPGLAWLAYCADIEGNVFGLFESDMNAR